MLKSFQSISEGGFSNFGSKLYKDKLRLIWNNAGVFGFNRICSADYKSEGKENRRKLPQV